jgi:hypothetical protein
MLSRMAAREGGWRIAVLFLVVVLGVLASWFWGLGWAYLRDPSAGLYLGTAVEIVVRVVLSLIAAALTFVPTYNKVGQSSAESWVPFFLAFQNGFFWEATFDALI